MISLETILLDPGLCNGEVGPLVDGILIDTRHPDGVALDSDQWARLREMRQASGRPLHWWEVPTNG